jgi:hypothetical protein
MKKVFWLLSIATILSFSACDTKYTCEDFCDECGCLEGECSTCTSRLDDFADCMNRNAENVCDGNSDGAGQCADEALMVLECIGYY